MAALSNSALDENQLTKLAAVIEKLRLDGRDLQPLTPFKLAIVGNGTLDSIASALVATAPRHGILLECIKADFGQTLQEAIVPDSEVNSARPDAVLMALDHRGLPFQYYCYDESVASASIDEALRLVEMMASGFAANGGAQTIAQTIAPPAETIFGSLDISVPGSPLNLVARYNRELVERAKSGFAVTLDIASLANTVGLSSWHSPTQWNLAKLSFNAVFLPLYADYVCRLIGAMKGKSRRCLVLDLDNTLWGGIIGDDGVDGIVIGQGDATGEAFLSVQKLALQLRDRGVVLAVSSKNEDSAARLPFQLHPEMLLKEDHIAVFQANWGDKASNIAAIATELSLGIDSMVFLDDNPVERAFVRESLPAVAVPELPEDPALYARTLAAAGYFESVAFSDDDRRRAEFYQDNARRIALQGQVGNLDDYLRSLQMEITFLPFDANGRARITQLVNKSNQFNLTTRRYGELEVEELEKDPTVFTMQIRLTDRFGDNGMISVVVCRERQGCWEIDTWLMSCRVLGRGVERMVLREILHHARRRGIEVLIGVYRPTAKNAMVSDHYSRLGFAHVETNAVGESTWHLGTGHEIEGAPMDVIRSGFETILS